MENGGSIHKNKSEIGGGHGYYVLFQDVNQNFIGLWSKE